MSRLTSFSKLIITLSILAVLALAGSWLMSINTPSDNAIERQIVNDLENQGYTNISVGGSCGWYGCGSSSDDVSYKKSFKVVATSSFTHRRVEGCACYSIFGGGISYNW